MILNKYVISGWLSLSKSTRMQRERRLRVGSIKFKVWTSTDFLTNGLNKIFKKRTKNGVSSKVWTGTPPTLWGSPDFEAT